MQQGTIKFFNESKGFCFITPTKGGPDIFVHISAVDYGDPKEKDVVTFDIVDGKKGKAAANVHLV